jgi:hypothetical protein
LGHEIIFHVEDAARNETPHASRFKRP